MIEAGPLIERALAVAGRQPPTGPEYSLLLLAHVLFALVGFGSTGFTGVQAYRARRGYDQATADGLRRYFRPGVNFASRAIYLVPAFGVALVFSSDRAYTFASGFVDIGLVMWVVAVYVAEAVVWSGERKIQQSLEAGWDKVDAESLRTVCTRVAAGAAFLLVIFFVVSILMVAQP